NGASNRCGGGRRGCVVCVCANYTAGVNPVAEGADDAEEFVMTIFRVRSCLDDDVRCFVNGICRSIDEVKQATASAWSIEERVSGCGHRRSSNRRCCGEREPSSADSRLWSFDGNAKSKLAAKVFDHSEAVLPLPAEADCIL